MADEERKYTLQEAKRILAVRECNRFGHDWEVIAQNWARMPTRIICGRCGWSGAVTMDPVERDDSMAESRT